MARIDIKYTKLFINNEFVDASNKKTFPTLNPATGEKIADVSEATVEDVDKAVSAARKAFARNSEWRNLDASQRGKLLNKFADLIEKDADKLAKLEALNNGKPVSDAVLDIVISADTLRYYAGWCDKIHGNTIPADGSFLCMTYKEPIGVCGQLIPWNYPIMMAIWKWGPALAAGCTIVMKPADQTPLTVLYLAALSREAGYPAGVINVVPGYGSTAGAAIAAHMHIDKVAFTGSTVVGRKIMEAAAKSNLKKVSLELGGKSPLVIFDDADIDEAVEIAHNTVFDNQGQNCCAGSRTFVHEKIYDEFVKKATIKAKQRKLGDQFSDDTKQGPQIDERSMNKILDLIESGKKQGAKLETGGKKFGAKGFFVEPTVFSNVTDDMRIAREEIFGPVQSILRFSTLEEVIKRANDTNYGLAGGIITNNISSALTFTRALSAGTVWVNCYDYVTHQAPFGGYKQSGFGRELGEDSLNEYLETKTVFIKTPTKN